MHAQISFQENQDCCDTGHFDIDSFNYQIKVAASNLNARLIAYGLWVKRVGTFSVVLYRNQSHVNLILYFARIAYW